MERGREVMPATSGTPLTSMTFNQDEFTKKVIKSMEEKLSYHLMLAKYTNQSVLLKKHFANIKLWGEIIDDYKKEYDYIE